LKDITVMMGQEVKMQGEQLNVILDDIEVAKSNAQLAQSLISEAERSSRKQMKRIILMVLTIVLIVAIIISVVLVISLGK
jgi:t-SNARE complex subunit (syntaxin)